MAALHFEFDDAEVVNALNLSAFIYDINRIYVSTYYAAMDRPRPRGFGRNFFALPRSEALRIGRIRFESPGFVDLATIALGGGGLIATMVTLLYQSEIWPLQKKKLELEIEKLEYEKRLRADADRLETVRRDPHVYSATGQLKKNPLKPTSVGIRVDRQV